MKRLLGLLFGLEIMDGIVTRWAVTSGAVHEWNHFTAAMAGDWQFLLLKVLGAAVSAFALWLVYRRFPTMARVGANCIVIFYVMVLCWNFSRLLPA